MSGLENATLPLALLLVTAAPARAEAPRVYAITGARIVTAAGPPLESGTVVLRGGVIEAVGESVTPPADAELIDGRGLTVYPGLIDLGNTAAAESSLAPPPQNPATRAELERWKRTQLLRPQVSAASLYKVDSPELKKLASGGVTSALVLPPGEGIMGQSALVTVVAPEEEPQIGSLAEARRGPGILKAPVAIHVSLPNRPQGDTYPESLMGMIAFVRQALLDAQHYQAEIAHSRRAVVPDPALEALQPAIAGRLPVAIEANLAREIDRALSMAKDFNLDPIIVGGLEASETTAELKARKARVIFSLNYPERPKALAPDADEPLRILRQRANAPRVPSTLAAAGVTFAFGSAGLKDVQQFVANAARAVKAGLPVDAAVRALTIDAARIAGLADRIGSIERGKLANIIVTEGDLFSPGMAIRHVFIDGRPVELGRH
jgi:imidazolonepropionase-like amidohydrolase